MEGVLGGKKSKASIYKMLKWQCVLYAISKKIRLATITTSSNIALGSLESAVRHEKKTTICLRIRKEIKMPLLADNVYILSI